MGTTVIAAQLRTVDLAVMVIYLIGVFALGCWFARRNKDTAHFMTAGGRLGAWVVGLSIFGTYMSSIGFLGNTGEAFGNNWHRWTFGLTLPIAAYIAVRWFVPFYRRGGYVSAYEHLEERFGPWARTYSLCCYLLSQLARIGTILFLVALALAPLTGWNLTTIILLTGILVTVYTLLGGIEAVIWTDVIQSIVLILGAVLCLILVLSGIPGGASEAISIANEHDKFSLGSFRLDPNSLTLPDATFWIVLAYGIFINLQNFGVDQNFVQRYATAKSERDAKRSVWLGALLFLPVSTLLFFMGTSLYSYAKTDEAFLTELREQVAERKLEQNGIAVTESALTERSAALTDKELGDNALPHFIANKLPMGVAGLLLAAIFAAAMSSMDTSLNSSASLWLCDIHKRYLRPEASERESMRVLRTATLVVGMAGTGVALAMINVQGALRAWWDLQGIFTGGMLGLFLLGMIARRAKKPQALLGVVIGVLMIAWLSLTRMKFWPEAWSGVASPFSGLLTIVLGTSTIVLVGGLASWWASAKRRS